MRQFVLALVFLCFATPAAGQELARQVVTVQVRIPDVMKVEIGDESHFVRADGKHVRRVMLLVTANRRWRLDVQRSCTSDCSTAGYAVSMPTGGPGASQPVIVECVWEAREAAPSATEFEYSLTTD